MLSTKLLVLDANRAMFDRRPDIFALFRRKDVYALGSNSESVQLTFKSSKFFAYFCPDAKGFVGKHFKEYEIDPSLDMVRIIRKSNREKLLTLEALYIEKIKPVLNTKDKYRRFFFNHSILFCILL